MEETLKNILNFLPVWEDEIWKALQDKRFHEAARRFGDLLVQFTDEEWNNVAWEMIFSGSPATRGEIQEDEWKSQVAPKLAQAALDALEKRKSAPPITAPAPAQTTLRVSTEEAQQSPAIEEGKPLVLHEEKKETNAPQSRPGFSLPFSLFRSKTGERGDSKTARIETPEERKTEKRVVHYSESRTSVSPFGKEPDFLQRKPEPVPTPPQSPAPQKRESSVPMKTEENKETSKNGNNVIDLSNLS